MSITLGKIFDLLNAKIIWGEDELDRRVEKAFAGDMMSDVLSRTESGDLLLTNLIGPQVIRTAEMTDLVGIVLVSNKEPNQVLVQMIRELRVPLAITSIPLFCCCGILYNEGVIARGDY